MILPLSMALVGVLLMVGDAWRARKRVLDYCRNAGLEAPSLRITFVHCGGPFSPYRGKHIFRGILRGAGPPEEFPAWFSSAGFNPHDLRRAIGSNVFTITFGMKKAPNQAPEPTLAITPNSPMSSPLSPPSSFRVKVARL